MRRKLARTDSVFRLGLWLLFSWGSAFGQECIRPLEAVARSAVPAIRRMPASEPFAVDLVKFGQGTLAQWEAMLHRPAWYSDPRNSLDVRDYYDAYRHPQELIKPEDLSREEQALVKHILEISTSYRVREREARKLMENSLAAGKPDHAKSVLNEQGMVKGVEVEGIRVSLKSGKVVTAVLTSSLGDRILTSDFIKAWDGLAASQGFTPSDIDCVQLFHNHSPQSNDPLSFGDQVGVGMVKRFQLKGLPVPVHVYAIVEKEGQPFLFHAH